MRLNHPSGESDKERKKCNEAWESAGGDGQGRRKPETRSESSPVSSTHKENAHLYILSLCL